jgi:hypothetical protein
MWMNAIGFTSEFLSSSPAVNVSVLFLMRLSQPLVIQPLWADEYLSLLLDNLGTLTLTITGLIAVLGTSFCTKFRFVKRLISGIKTWIIISGFILICCTVQLLLFCAMTNKSTVYWQLDAHSESEHTGPARRQHQHIDFLCNKTN